MRALVVHATREPANIVSLRLNEKIMRRQIKPFVTEYRAGLRRGKDAAASPQAAANESVSKSQQHFEAEKTFRADAVDESYEAALRAADALFGPPAARDKSHITEVARPAHRFTHPGQPQGSHVPNAEAAQPATSGAAEIGDEPVKPSAQGRILQAIEPVNDERFAFIEAERAPKRRGRKPGSKNKPKTTEGEKQPELLAYQAPSRSSGSDNSRQISRVAATQFVWPSDDEADKPDTAAAPINEPGIKPPRGRTTRGNRKIVTLRPGERWKRRLPRAAW